ncbi:hypothetical protein RJT34_05348 [Clitoria ternatea]|uniref:Uncharacterized protein n=1 Tax=Clitoria ternatea TaxID=43366 RepID=A0AAN9PSZ5_CLITE
MGQELELDLNDKSSVGLSPDTVLPSHQYCLNVKKVCKNGEPIEKDEFLRLRGKFADINFANISHGVEGNVEIRQSSTYQSSEQQVINIKQMGTTGLRKKIEISCRSSDSSFSGSVVDSLCGSDDESLDERPSILTLDSNYGSPSSSVSGSWACMERNTSNGFIEFCLNSDVCDKKSSVVEGIGYTSREFRSDEVAVGSVIDGNFGLLKDTDHGLQNSLSISHLQSPLRSECSSRASSKVQRSPITKRLNPFRKSTSMTSPVSCVLEATQVKLTGTRNVTRNRTYQKSLLNDFSNASKHSDIISEFINRDIQHSGLSYSPVHLHGNLKLKNKQGLPFFEFKVKCPEVVFVAKTWESSNAFSRVYTFHSIDNRKKTTATGLGSRYSDKGSSMVAQMPVSYNLCSELEGGVFDNTMVTEFVLYDLTHSRSVSPEKKSFSRQECSKTTKSPCVEMKGETLRSDEETLTIKSKDLSGNADFDKSNSYPLPLTKLHSNPEMAAVVLQIPFRKRESLKYKRGDKINAETYSTPCDLSSAVDQSSKSPLDRKVQEQVKVVLPTGNHGSPNAESKGPSSLIDRWKHRGGCDCGGWDMACPLLLLDNPSIQFPEDRPLMEEYQTLELFTQGSKERSPTFSMRVVEEGQYAVDFHAQLSPLQAFSICVAILHGTSTFSGVAGQEKIKRSSQCNSLKMLIEEEVEFLIKSVTKEQKKTVSKIHKGIPPHYVVNPPFSPMARV